MNLSVKIFISLILSVIVGLILGEENLPWLKAYLAPFGTMFINLIKMIIVPVVLASLVCGVASLGDTKKLGRIGIKVVLLYLVTKLRITLRRARSLSLYGESLFCAPLFAISYNVL